MPKSELDRITELSKLQKEIMREQNEIAESKRRKIKILPNEKRFR